MTAEMLTLKTVWPPAQCALTRKRKRGVVRVAHGVPHDLPGLVLGLPLFSVVVPEWYLGASV